MQKTGVTEAGRRYQFLAILICLALALLMIFNTQMGGEAMWFWYATVFRHGAKLYTNMHTALQPLFILENAAWMSLFGKRIAVYEIPSVIHAFLLAFGFLLVLRESAWPDWQKAVVLLGSFVFTVLGHSYRFDDYHVIAECLILYALWLLLVLGRPAAQWTARQTTLLVAALALICGLAFVTRVTDGAALITAGFICLAFILVPGRKTVNLVVFVGVTTLTVILVVALTGDTLHAYLMNSIFRAAGSKGGTGSILTAPFWGFVNVFPFLRGMKKVGLYVALLFFTGWAIARYWKKAMPWMFPLQLCVAVLLFLLASPVMKVRYKNGVFYEFLVLILTTGMYLIFAYTLVRYIRFRLGRGTWDRREILTLLPVLEWASYSAGAAAEPLTNYYAPAVLLMLLFPVLQPFRKQAVWVNSSVLTVFALVAFWGTYVKLKVPYSWQNYVYGRMFQNRELFHHPVYGEMYIDRDLLQFSQRVCKDIGAIPGQPGPDLLSLPYPYPNYFCNTPPWHDYVQTFFDTAPRATVEKMMYELNTDPPHWIIYQRQINIMNGSERLYNHSHPIAQRALDSLIMNKIASGQWKLVDESSYLKSSWWHNTKDTDWYIIQTHPTR